MYNHTLFYATIKVDTLSDRVVIIYFVFPVYFSHFTIIRSGI